jgi:hypothetical protein
VSPTLTSAPCPTVQHLALDGHNVICSKELRNVCNLGSALVKSLELRGMPHSPTSSCVWVHHLLAMLPAETKHNLPPWQVSCTYS